MSEGDRFIGLTLGDVEEIESQLREYERTRGMTPNSDRPRANDRQVGGSHYRKGTLQHWDVVDKYRVPYLEGVGSKYPLRWRDKGGLEDLRKTLHYIDKILERPDSDPTWQRRLSLHTDLIRDSSELCEAHAVGPVERRVVLSLLQGVWRETLVAVRGELAEYIDRVAFETLPGSPEDGGHAGRATEEAEDGAPRRMVHEAEHEPDSAADASSGGVGEELRTIGHVHIHPPVGSSGTVTKVGDSLVVVWRRG